MGIKTFQIELSDGQNGVYTAGQWLRGRVLVNFDKPTKANKIYLRFYGAADVYWTESETTGTGDKQETRTVTYSNHETYFEYKVPVWTSGTHGPRHPAGQGMYTFEYQLPPNIPSSFEGGTGWVRYYIECVIDRPWKFDHKTKMPFTVNSVLDLNQYPATREPIQVSNSKKLCCWCCKSGPITNRLTLDRQGFVSGEYIVVNAEIDNKSNRTMNSSSLMLKQTTTFHATSKSTSAGKTLAKFKHGAVKPGHSDIWNGQLIHVPPLPPSSLIHCKIIDIKYHVELVTHPAGPSFKLETPCEVTIGTIPLSNMQHVYCASPTVPSSPANPDTTSALSTSMPPTQVSANAPPPSYEQCIGGRVSIRGKDDRYTHGQLEYTPQYPYYSWKNGRYEYQ